MKKVIVKDLEGVQIAGAELDDPSVWIAECEEHGFWGEPGSYTVEILDISEQFTLAKIIEKRRAEYPNADEFMDALFDGGEAGMQALREKRLAIKAKYPKPSGN